ncbi:nitroreductase family protein [Paenibacillus sp. 2TAB23]|uniref:nitroreductase family protein n=1 Tax=Paenibacillus sp. 2TAB23 TaxID=3233004 RepID=UPI003F98815C
MEFSATIKERRTIRRFKSTPIKQELIASLLEQAANLYAAEEQPRWRCTYYDTFDARLRLGKSMIAKVKESTFGKLIPDKMMDIYTRQITQTPAHLVFVSEASDDERESDAHYAAVCSIIQNFQLLGWKQGLGMIWYTDPVIKNEAFYKEIGLKDGERFAGILSVGYFEKTPRARKRTPAEQKWTLLGGVDSSSHAEPARITPQHVLEMLNVAVWAPNDGLREPWRFIYVDGGEAARSIQPSLGNPSQTHLLVLMKEEADLHKREEDYAAVCCLIQNVMLLAQSAPWHVRRHMPEWIYDRTQYGQLEVGAKERIVAILEFGGNPLHSDVVPTATALDLTRR